MATNFVYIATIRAVQSVTVPVRIKHAVKEVCQSKVKYLVMINTVWCLPK